jgi:maleate isomerase
MEQKNKVVKERGQFTGDSDLLRSDCGKPGLNRRQFLNLASVATASSVIGRSPAALAAAKVPWRADGTGMARIGLLVPSHDFNPESEIWAMAPKGVAILASRMDRGTLPFLTHVSDASHADAAIGLLKALKLRAILYAYSGTSYVMGLAGEEAFRARLAARVQAIPIVLAAAALSEAMHALRVHRLAVVHPPWFSEELSDMGKAYFSARGFQVVSCARITPARELTEVDAEEVHGWITANTPSNAEAVVVAGNGLRAVGAIDALEGSLGRPVITANQAMLWQGLRVAGVPSRMDEYGRLFKLEAAMQ